MPGETLELVIDSLSLHGGRGVGRTSDGMVVFVPFAVPGDHLRVQITHRKKNFLVAQIVEVVESSSQRRAPICPVFGKCGGCCWQHIQYEEQIRQKNLILRSALAPLRKHHDFEFRQIIPSPVEYRYRNRIQIHKHGHQVGFFAAGSHELVPVSDCAIAEHKIAAEIPGLAARPDGRYEISSMNHGQDILTRSMRNDPRAALFSQVNTAQNLRLIAELRAWIHEFHFASVIDLYCGSGNLSVPVAHTFPDVTIHAVDFSHEAIALARSQSSTIHWHAADAVEFLRSQRSRNNSLFILDPPRRGVEDALIQEIRRLHPQAAIYVSCDPMTFARDCAKLQRVGFRLMRVQGFDMFPQTEHIELMALVVRGMSSTTL